MGLFGVAHGGGGGGGAKIPPPKKSPLLKICHIYPARMELGTLIAYLKKIKKSYESRDTHPELW